jgi:hypothetical protein
MYGNAGRTLGMFDTPDWDIRGEDSSEELEPSYHASSSALSSSPDQSPLAEISEQRDVGDDEPGLFKPAGVS